MPIRETGRINLNDFNSELSRNDNTELNFQDIATEFSLEPPNYGDTEPGLGFEELRGASKDGFATFVTINPTSLTNTQASGDTRSISYNSDGNFRINDDNISFASVVLNSGSESENFENSFDVIIDSQELDAIARSETITLESPNMTNVSITVGQLANDASIAITAQTGTISYGYNGGDGEYFKIETAPDIGDDGVSWTVSLSDTTYFKHRIWNSGDSFVTTNISGIGDEFIEVKAESNDTTDSKSNTSTVTATNLTAGGNNGPFTITSTMAANPVDPDEPVGDYITISNTYYDDINEVFIYTSTIPYNSSTAINFTVSSTAGYNVSGVSEFSDPSNGFSVSNPSLNTVRVTPTSHTDTSAREFISTITLDSNPSFSVKLKVNQAAAPSAEISGVSDLTWSYNQFGTGQYKSLSFTVTNNLNSNPTVSVIDIVEPKFALLSTWETSNWTYDFPVTIGGTQHYLLATRNSNASRNGTMSVRVYPIQQNSDSSDKVTNAEIGVGSESETSTLTQEFYVVPTYSWGGTVSIPRNSGTVTVSGDDSAGTITITPSSFDLVTSQTTRTVVIGNIVIPSGYQNAGTSFSQTFNPIQDAADETITITSSTGNEIDGQGESFVLNVTTPELYNTQWVASITYADPSNSSNWVGFAPNNSGTDNASLNMFVVGNYSGQSGYDGTQRNFEIRVDKVGGGVSSNILSFYQNVGSPPVQAPTFTVSPTSENWTYSQSGTGNSKAITATWNGGSVPTSVSFYLSGTYFGLYQEEANVPITVSGGPWVATATSTSGISQYRVGVYPINQNSGVSDLTENLSVTMGNSGGNTPIDVPLTHTGNINWETDVSSLSFGSSGGTETITLTTSLSWTASVSGTGFSIDTTSGTAGTRYINVTSLSSDDSSSGTVTLSASGQSDIVVSLSKAAAPLEYTWFFNGSSQSGASITLTPSTISISYAIGLYAYRGSTPVATTWMLSRVTAGSWIDAATTTSGTTSSATATSTQNTNGTPNLYLNIETNTGSARSGQAEITVDGAYVATIYVNQDGVSGGSGGGPGEKPDPGDIE
jgi:hypothetical protein